MLPLFAAHSYTFALPEIPSEAWWYLLTFAAGLLAKYLRDHGMRPVLVKLLEAFAGDAFKPKPPSPPVLSDPPPAVDLDNHPIIQRIAQVLDRAARRAGPGEAA